MIIVNELYRPFIKEKPWTYLGFDACPVCQNILVLK